MATLRIPILGAATLPDTSGNVTPEPAAVNFQSNDRYPGLVWKFADTSTRDKLGGSFTVPQNYVGTPKVRLYWGTTATSGNARLEFDYTAIADGESADPSADQESVASTVAAPGTARLVKVTEIALTAGNFAAGDLVQFSIARDGAEAGPLDTIAAALYLLYAEFVYNDA
jgi:hypothetical protein